MSQSTRIKLMIMMFLQFFCWGAWYGQITIYLEKSLNATPVQQGNAFAALSIAMLISPIFVGMIADRFFSAQKVLGVLNLIGALLLWLIISVDDPSTFFWYILCYCLTFAPTIALTSSIAMRQMENPSKDFASVRVMGTIAWICVLFLIGRFDLGSTSSIFSIAMATSLGLGVYAFFLPDTPPSENKGQSLTQILGLEAFALLKDRSFLIFFVSSILICIPLSFYYAMANPSLNDLGLTNVEGKMSLGQVSEILFMILLPFFYKKFGVKWVIIIALLAWVIRFIGFGFGDADSLLWLIYVAILLHGVSYDFFFVSGQIYTDNKAGVQIKSQAQSLISFATYGLGMLIGSLLSGYVKDHFTTTSTNWTNFWMVPAAIAGIVLILFVLFFKDNTRLKTKI